MRDGTRTCLYNAATYVASYRPMLLPTWHHIGRLRQCCYLRGIISAQRRRYDHQQMRKPCLFARSVMPQRHQPLTLKTQPGPYKGPCPLQSHAPIELGIARRRRKSAWRRIIFYSPARQRSVTRQPLLLIRSAPTATRADNIVLYALQLPNRSHKI